MNNLLFVHYLPNLYYMPLIKCQLNTKYFGNYLGIYTVRYTMVYESMTIKMYLHYFCSGFLFHF